MRDKIQAVIIIIVFCLAAWKIYDLGNDEILYYSKFENYQLDSLTAYHILNSNLIECGIICKFQHNYKKCRIAQEQLRKKKIESSTKILKMYDEGMK